MIIWAIIFTQQIAFSELVAINYPHKIGSLFSPSRTGLIRAALPDI
jgi:hypothetical protein